MQKFSHSHQKILQIQGILMEDKNGVRRCVQCEVYKEYQDKRKLANNDLGK